MRGLGSCSALFKTYALFFGAAQGLSPDGSGDCICKMRPGPVSALQALPRCPAPAVRFLPCRGHWAMAARCSVQWSMPCRCCHGQRVLRCLAAWSFPPARPRWCREKPRARRCLRPPLTHKARPLAGACGCQATDGGGAQRPAALRTGRAQADLGRPVPALPDTARRCGPAPISAKHTAWPRVADTTTPWFCTAIHADMLHSATFWHEYLPCLVFLGSDNCPFPAKPATEFFHCLAL